jgi:hypothetical protein
MSTEPFFSALIAQSSALNSERETGIGPASLAWKARALPLCYSRVSNRKSEIQNQKSRVGARGFDLSPSCLPHIIARTPGR